MDLESIIKEIWALGWWFDAEIIRGQAHITAGKGDEDFVLATVADPLIAFTMLLETIRGRTAPAATATATTEIIQPQA
jgi:hypothetical protein